MTHECEEKRGGGSGSVSVRPNPSNHRRPVDLQINTNGRTVTIDVNFCPYCGQDFRRTS